MFIMTYFHPILGPDVILAAPEKLIKTIHPDVLNEIKNLLDTAEPGFFTHMCRGNVNTANFFFTIKSQWARGREEMVLISKILQETDPNLEIYENQFIKFASKIQKEIPELYRAFYFRNPPNDEKELIKQKLSMLRDYFFDLYNEFSLIKIRTFGALVPVEFINEQKMLHIPARFTGDISKTAIKEDQHNLFTVYQFKDGRLKIELMPVKCENVLKITIFFRDVLNPEAVRKIGEIFSNYNLPLIYTSGICASQQGKCIYEVYLDSTSAPNREILFKELMQIEKVDEVKIILINS